MATKLANLSQSVSLLHNNLASSSGGWVASVHNSISTGGKLLLHHTGTGPKEGPEGSQITSVRYLQLASAMVLCVSSTNGTQIYSEDASTLLFFAPVGESTDADEVKQHKGACVVPQTQQIFVGTYKGSLIGCQATGENILALPETSPGNSAVADLCYNELANSLVSVHANGDIHIWVASTAGGPYIDSNVIPAAGKAPVRIASLGARIVVAFGPGTVCLFDAITFQCQAEVTAHARWITGVSVQEDTGKVATVGEDTVLNVWNMKAGPVTLAHSQVVTDKLLTGVAFHSGGACACVVAYDSDELFSAPLSS